MRMLFPCYPLRPTNVDPDFADEAAAAAAAGFAVDLFNLEALTAGSLKKAFAGLAPLDAPQTTIHRGWMMSDRHYDALHAGLASLGRSLLVSPAHYEEMHYLPNAYPKLGRLTPESVWVEGHDPDVCFAAYESLAGEDAILKDYVKSAKHLWNEACFIPRHSTRARFGEILRAFVADRGALFEKGIVLRRFVPLASDGRDKRGHPRTTEHRYFFVSGKEILPTNLAPVVPSVSEMADVHAIARRFDSPFFSLDLALAADGRWVIIEVGDGGVSGLPVSLTPDDFYAALREALGPTT